MNSLTKYYRCKINDHVFGPMLIADLRNVPGFTMRSLVAPIDEENWIPAYHLVDHSEHYDWDQVPGTGRVIDLGLKTPGTHMKTMNNFRSIPPPVEIPKMQVHSIPTFHTTQKRPQPQPTHIEPWIVPSPLDKKEPLQKHKGVMGWILRYLVGATTTLLLGWLVPQLPMLLHSPAPVKTLAPAAKPALVKPHVSRITPTLRPKQKKGAAHLKATPKKQKPTPKKSKKI